jgi:hypothetical protein
MEEISQEIKTNFIEAQFDVLTNKRRKTFCLKNNQIFINPLKKFDLLNDCSTNENDSFEFDLEELAKRKFNNKRDCLKMVEEVLICKIPKPVKRYRLSNKYPEVDTKIPKIILHEID